jgi:hypothetical protein
VAVCALYNLAGERLAQSNDVAGSGTLIVPWGGYASGVYLLDLRFQVGTGVLARRSAKIAIVK